MERQMPLVSIGIPTFNRANSYLQHSLASALNQTYPHLEVIVSDNCSTDNTEDFVKSFTRPCLKYFKQSQNLGPNGNANFCLTESRGDYFFLLHDDDMIDHDFIETCMKAADYATDIGIIRTGIRYIGSDGKVYRQSENPAGGLSLDEFFMAWFDGKIPMHLCGTVFNTRYLRELGGFDNEYDPFQDVAAEVELAASFRRVDIKEIKASFRQHMSSQTSSKDIQHWIDASDKLLEKLCELASEKGTIFKEKARVFFAHHNYSLAKGIRPLWLRFWAFVTVFNAYGYPLEFLWTRSAMYWAVRRLLGNTWRRVNRA